MHTKLRSSLLWGAIHGAGAWSAYAIIEFIFSSLVFRFTRPYGGFTVWHWRLTALLLIGYLLLGLMLGAVAGVWLYIRRKDDYASAATLTLVVSLLLNVCVAQGLRDGGGVLLGIAFLFVVLLCVPSWQRPLGWLSTPWVISGLWLGVGQQLGLLQLGIPQRFGPRPALLAAALLAAAAVAAVMIGRRVPVRVSRLSGISCAAAVLLLATCAILSSDTSANARASGSDAINTSRPNVVLIVMDTVRADHLSLYGYERDTTPNLKALARDSAVYVNAVSTSDITLTSHASLFDGMYPSWHGAYCRPSQAAYGREIAPQYPTLAELLGKHRYETLGVAANLYLRADFGLERGFDQFRIPRPVPMLSDENRHMFRRALRRALSIAFDTTQFDRLYAMGADIDAELFATLDRRARPADPFFAFINYMDAHFPYVPPAPYGHRTRITQDDLEAQQEQISKGRSEPSGYRRNCESQYDAGIAYVDAQIGKVVDWLKSRNAYDSAMIVVVSDHGESFGDRNRVGHGNSPYQNLLHVVLSIKYPHAATRGTITTPVSLIDVAPTVLSTLNLPIPGNMQGKPLTDSAAASRKIYSETFACPVMHPLECPNGCAAKAIFEWPLKFIVTDNGKRELFDLSQDPDEHHNLQSQEQGRAAELATDLAAWSRALPAQTHDAKQIDPEKLKQLESLGYIGH